MYTWSLFVAELLLLFSELHKHGLDTDNLNTSNLYNMKVQPFYMLFECMRDCRNARWLTSTLVLYIYIYIYTR